MNGKVCCFIGHRKIEESGGVIERATQVIKDLIVHKGVNTFLFGSRSEFDDVCHDIVTNLQKAYPQIKRIMYKCRSEYAVKKEEKAQLEKTCSKLLHREVQLKDYEGEVMSDRLWSAGKASYVERNQDMINASDYCVFYYNPQYQPPKAGASGTRLAYDYAFRKKRDTIINIYT